MLNLATKFVPERNFFRTAAQAGFRCAEFWLDASYLAHWQTVAETANEFPLRYALHFPNCGDLDDGALDQAVALYQALGCATMVIHQPMFRRYHERLLDRDRPNCAWTRYYLTAGAKYRAIFTIQGSVKGFYRKRTLEAALVGLIRKSILSPQPI